MAKKKDAQSDEQKALEQKVDAMMAPDRPDLPVADVDEKNTPKKEVYKPEIPEKPPIVMTLAGGDSEKPSPVEAPAPEEETPEREAMPADESDEADDAFNDKETDNAVDDIAAHESDKLLAVDDAVAARKQKQAAAKSSGGSHRLKKILKSKWTWILLLVIAVTLLAVPATRYKVLGLAVKRPVSVTVLDSKTSSPVSNAEVSLGGATTKTDGSGKAKLNALIGARQLSVKKEYYAGSEQAYFVGFKPKSAEVKLAATGRLVPIEITNRITGKPISGATIKVLNTTARTDNKGKALIALPTNVDKRQARLLGPGYNQAVVTVQVTDQNVKANSFKLIPSGKVYFLSNLSGKIDVIKANLDGTSRKVVFEGTGREDQNTTSLLASRDWRYLVLKSKREGKPSLYLIDASNDKVTQFDNSDAEFELVGWHGHDFVYSLTRNNTPYHQTGRQALKSYDAENKQLNQLDQNQAEGDAGNYAYQNLYNFYIVNGLVAYNTVWYGQGNLDGKSATIRGVQPNGQNKRDYQTFPANLVGNIQAALYEPNEIYYAVYANDGKTTYYEFEDQAAKAATLDAGAFNKLYPTFLVSPTAKKTFWSELRDGKNTLFTGDADAKQAMQIASLSSYAPYGWFSDNYLLVSKEGSELYILPSSGLAKNQQPLKVTDYYKPATVFTGYGYGYGGL